MYSARSRVLPDFLIIGTQRGGTSSLFRYLSKHPQVLRPLRKETEYFAGRYDRGLDWYQAHFPRRSSLGSNRRRITFEATPDYLLDPRSASRAVEVVPDAKLIALLRDPVDRAYSHYQHMVRSGFENLSFEAALEAEHERCAADWARIEAGELVRSTNILRFSYVERGHYADQLTRWLDCFGAERTHVVISERFFRHTREALQEIEDFLGLDRWIPRSLPNHGFRGGYNDVIRQDTVEELIDHYRPHNDRLRSILAADPGWGY